MGLTLQLKFMCFVWFNWQEGVQVTAHCIMAAVGLTLDSPDCKLRADPFINIPYGHQKKVRLGSIKGYIDTAKPTVQLGHSTVVKLLQQGD